VKKIWKGIFILFLIIFSSYLLIQTVHACRFIDVLGLYSDSKCQKKVVGKTWVKLSPGCVCGVYAKAYWKQNGCRGPSDFLFSCPGNNGAECMIRWGLFCGKYFYGKWDASTSSCVKCNGVFKTKEVTCKNKAGKSVYKCESACGADKLCDEKRPGSVCRTCYPYKRSITCTNKCECPPCPNFCSSNNDCVSGYTCNLTTHKCVKLRHRRAYPGRMPRIPFLFRIFRIRLFL
jgi:hypothetical protein